jgi:hypothetical protein
MLRQEQVSHRYQPPQECPSSDPVREACLPGLEGRYINLDNWHERDWKKALKTAGMEHRPLYYARFLPALDERNLKLLVRYRSAAERERGEAVAALSDLCHSVWPQKGARGATNRKRPCFQGLQAMNLTGQLSNREVVP